MDECAVCFEATAARLAPCAHAVCAACAGAWLDAGRRTCPLCRQLVVAHPRHAGPGARDRVILFDEGTHAGVTLTAHARGVRVSALDPRDRARASGVRVGDVITHVNGLAVGADHAAAVALVDRATACRAPLACTIASPPRREGLRLLRSPRVPWVRWWGRRSTRRRAGAAPASSAGRRGAATGERRGRRDAEGGVDCFLSAVLARFTHPPTAPSRMSPSSVQASATKAATIHDPDAVLFRWSVELQEAHTQLCHSFRGARLEDPKGTVTGVYRGTISVKTDEGATVSVPLTQRRAAQLSQLQGAAAAQPAQTGATTRK